MDPATEGAVARTVSEVLALLVTADYDGLATLTDGERLTSDEIRSSVEDYGRTLMMPPGDLASHLEITRVLAAGPRKLAVALDLWTEEEGQSDLSLELTLTDNGDSGFRVEIDDLHVL